MINLGQKWTQLQGRLVTMANNKTGYQIFISYRRDGGDYFARLLFDRLEAYGYKPFYDVESLRSGKFNEQLLSVIEECPDFIIVLPKGGLDRCCDENDWVRREVGHAILTGRNIIPITLRGFDEFPQDLPDELRELPNYQAITANDTETFSYAMDKLCGYLRSKPKRSLFGKRTESAGRTRLALGIAVLAITLFVSLGGILATHNLLHKETTPQSDGDVSKISDPSDEAVSSDVVEPEPDPIRLIATRSPLNVREGPGNAYPIARSIDDMTILLNYGKAENGQAGDGNLHTWYYVNIEGTDVWGYVIDVYVKAAP